MLFVTTSDSGNPSRAMGPHLREDDGWLKFCTILHPPVLSDSLMSTLRTITVVVPLQAFSAAVQHLKTILSHNKIELVIYS